MNAIFLSWPKLKLYCFLVVMPVIAVMLHLILFEDRAFNDVSIWLFSTPILFLLGIASMHFQIRYDRFVESLYPALQETRRRISLKAIVTVLLMPACVIPVFLLYDSLHLFGYQLHMEHLWQGALVIFSINLIFETLYEADFVFQRNRAFALENANIQVLSLKDEIDLLKNQINPHFLFNCFNTLSALIGTDKQAAVDFLNELSKVYRRLLKHNADSLNLLADELDFIESYYRLLRMRFGNAFRLRVQIDPQFRNYFLPAMALQLLVENSVKHNSLSEEQPLVVEIFTSGENKLVVNNNVQRKKMVAYSGGIGLNNIRKKYEILNVAGFQIMESNENFTVVLPLIWKQEEAIQATVSTVHKTFATPPRLVKKTRRTGDNFIN